MTEQDFSDILIAIWPAHLNSALKGWMCGAAENTPDATMRSEMRAFLESALLSDEERDRLIQDGRAQRDVWERHEDRLEQAKSDARQEQISLESPCE